MASRKAIDVEKHKTAVISILNNYMDNLISMEEEDIAKADKLSYWIENWVQYLKREDDFNPVKLRRYKRGEIIKVNLGFNIGSEEGGLHYAIVIDKDNSINDSTIRVVPLTSIKPNKDLESLPEGTVFLGNELFTSLSSKISSEKRKITQSINELKKLIKSEDIMDEKIIDEVNYNLMKLNRELSLINRMYTEIDKMKKGSLALVKQITTISKMRIYDSKTNYDILSNIKLSNEKLDIIDRSIISLYTKNG